MEAGAFFAIEEDLVAASGRAYWVERGQERSFVISGDFQGDTFSGEWLSSTGERGKLSRFRRIGIESSEQNDDLNEEMALRQANMDVHLRNTLEVV